MKKLIDFTIIDSNPKRVSSKNIPKNLLSIYLQTRELLKKPTNLLCTISGGQDSILTFFLLLHIYKKDYLQLLYCQHLWQIKNFFSARFIFQVSYLIQVPYTLILPQNLVLTENESRNWRKKNFSRFSQIEHIPTSFTGHTETDTLEQNLNNLLRGTSPAGLSSSRFLNFQNKVSLFFSSINLNTCFFCKLTKKTKFSPDSVFHKQKNKKRKKTFFKTNRLNTKTSLVLTKRIKRTLNLSQIKKFSLVHSRPKNFGISKFFNGDLESQNHRFWDNKIFGEVPEKQFRNSFEIVYEGPPGLRQKRENSLFFGGSDKKKVFEKKKQKNLKFSKSLKTFNQSVFFSFNFKRLDQQNSRKSQNLLVAKSSRNKTLLSPLETNFNFFYPTKYLLKRQTKNLFKQKESYSFCFSNQYFNMRRALIKPLEKKTRFTVSKLVNLYNLPTFIDITNFSSAFSRNNIRHQLIPFIRCLVHRNVEFLLMNFFKILDQEHQDREKEVYELYFLSKLLKLKFRQKRTNLKPMPKKFFWHRLKLDSILLKQKSTKKLMNNISENQAGSFIQKLFFEYKNLNLISLQIIKLQDFS